MRILKIILSLAITFGIFILTFSFYVFVMGLTAYFVGNLFNVTSPLGYAALGACGGIFAHIAIMKTIEYLTDFLRESRRV